MIIKYIYGSKHSVDELKKNTKYVALFEPHIDISWQNPLFDISTLWWLKEECGFLIGPDSFVVWVQRSFDIWIAIRWLYKMPKIDSFHDILLT